MDELSDYIIDAMSVYFSNRFKNYCISDLFDNEYNKSFSIHLIAYDYFPIVFTYDRGRIGCSLRFDKMTIALKNSQEWLDEADLNIFFKELEDELELRIPDKFLQVRGWLK